MTDLRTGPASCRVHNVPPWLAATYHDRYVRDGDRWLFSECVIDVAFFTPFDKGWAIEQFLPGRAPAGS